MKTLMVLRHAKSSWEEPLPDVARPLAPRGRRAAPAMGEHIVDRGRVPDIVLCSPAVRARQTCDLVLPTFGTEIPVIVEGALYDDGVAGQLDALRRIDDDFDTAMIVGHNPSLQQLAVRLCDSGDAELRDRLAGKFPTAALAVIELEVARWAALEAGAGRLVELVRPKELPEADARRL